MSDAARDSIDATWRAALAHHAAGRVRDAAVLYKRIVAVDPTHAQALHHLGVIAHGAGHHVDAARLIGMAAALAPDWPDAHVNLGGVLHALGRHDAAIDSYHRAIELSPTLAPAHNNLGNALRDAGRRDDAIACFRRAVEIDPAYATAHGNLGNALREAGRADEAIAAHRRAVELRPTDAKAHHNLSLSLGDAGRLAEANWEREHALSLDRSIVDGGPFNTAVIAAQRAASEGRPGDAAAAYRRAADLRPERADVWHNLSVVLVESADPDGAIAAAGRALSLRPDDVATLNNLAGALKAVGRVADAVACYRKAVAIGGPLVGQVRANLAYAVTFDPAATAADVLAAARACDSSTFSDGPKGRASSRREARPSGPSLNGRIRIGYVSPDFRDHVVGRNLLPLLRSHDRTAFEVFCYGAVARPDVMTPRFRAAADAWRDIAGLDDAAAADLIRSDRIDVLVDLTLHMAGNRLGVFDHRPAPVQVTFGGYPGTTGLSSIGYRLTDPYLDPPGTDGDYAERSVRLPHSFWCYDPVAMDVADAPEPGPPPAVANGFVTFGCLNNFCKVNPGVLAAWARVLDRVPGSRLTMFAPPGSARERVRTVLGDRVTFVPFMSRGDYLATYRGIDLCLDTFPYNGHTTSLDGLWMGVPTVTFVGPTVVGRAGFSQLSNLGLTELAAADVDGLVDLAVALASDLPRLIALRRGLRGRMRRSPLTDAAGFAGGIEGAYRRMVADGM
jgi:predicted O-linked N-acetylglucosamine transferase (SPINDLY family)